MVLMGMRDTCWQRVPVCFLAGIDVIVLGITV